MVEVVTHDSLVEAQPTDRVLLVRSSIKIIQQYGIDQDLPCNVNIEVLTRRTGMMQHRFGNRTGCEGGECTGQTRAHGDSKGQVTPCRVACDDEFTAIHLEIRCVNATPRNKLGGFKTVVQTCWEGVFGSQAVLN